MKRAPLRLLIGAGVSLILIVVAVVALFFNFKSSDDSCLVQNASSHACFKALQPAVDAAHAKDTLKVKVGTYAGGIRLNKSGLQLVALNTGGQVKVAGTPRSGPKFGFIVQADNIRIDGFEIYDFSGQPDAAGIFIGGTGLGDTSNRANNVVISHNKIHDNGNGLYLWQSSNDQISNNDIYHNLDFSGAEGIGIASLNGFNDTQIRDANTRGYSGKNTLIGYNNIYNNDRQGILIGSCSTESTKCQSSTKSYINISGTLIYYNHVYGNGNKKESFSEGIGLLGASGGAVKMNTVERNNFFGIFINHTQNVQVMNNKVNNNDLQKSLAPYNGGIRVSGSRNITVQTNSTLINQTGIRVTTSDASTFANNTAYSNMLDDLDWDNMGNMKFDNNQCHTAKTSVAVWHCVNKSDND